MRYSSKQRMCLGAHARGRMAYRLGIDLTNCPYVAVRLFKDAWEKGWTEERHRDMRRTRKTRAALAELKEKL